MGSGFGFAPSEKKTETPDEKRKHIIQVRLALTNPHRTAIQRIADTLRILK